MPDCRRTFPFFLLFLFVLLNSLSGFAGAQEDPLLKHPREMIFPPLVFDPPEAERHVLSNGMVVYLLEDAEVPLINLSALIRTGSVYDPRGQSGLAQVTAAALCAGGAKNRSPREINESLEASAAVVEFSMEREAGRGYLSVLKKDFIPTLKIFADLLRQPAFDAGQFDLVKKREIEAIRRSNDHPDEIAYREFRKVLFAGNPRAQVPTMASVDALRRDNLIAFHRQFFHPNNMILGISGDFKKEEMLKILEDIFGEWKRSIIELPLIPAPAPPEKQAIYHVEKDLTQATILAGLFSPPVDHPDHFPFKVLNFILGGGGFNSRLTREIRSNRGLAYSVGSFYQPRVGYGTAGAFCQTKSSTVHQAISLIFEIAGTLKKEKVTPQELAWAKNSLTNQFIFSFSSPASVVGQQIQLEYDGLPRDRLKHYRERVAAVTPEDLERVANQYIQPEKSVLLVVGKERSFEKPLSSFGPVTKLELVQYP